MQSGLTLSIEDMSDQQIIAKIQEAQRAVKDANDRTLRLGERTEVLKDFVHTDVNPRLVRVDERSSNTMWAVTIIVAALVASGVQLLTMNGRLSGMESDIRHISKNVDEMHLKQLSTNPKDPQNIAEARDLLRAAKSRNVQIDKALLKNSGEKFVDAAQDTPDAWNAALAFLDYRSFLNFVNTPTPIKRSIFSFKKVQMSANVDFSVEGGQLTVEWALPSERVPIDKSFIYQKLGTPLERTVGPPYLIARNARGSGKMKLDGKWLRNVILEGIPILYKGGPLKLENVQFLNCTFDIQKAPTGIEFAKSFLSPTPAINFVSN